METTMFTEFRDCYLIRIIRQQLNTHCGHVEMSAIHLRTRLFHQSGNTHHTYTGRFNLYCTKSLQYKCACIQHINIYYRLVLADDIDNLIPADNQIQANVLQSVEHDLRRRINDFKCWLSNQLLNAAHNNNNCGFDILQSWKSATFNGRPSCRRIGE